MTLILRAEKPALYLLTDSLGYLKGLKEIETIAGGHGMNVADAPVAVRTIYANGEAKDLVCGIGTTTSEHHGMINGTHVYKTVHGTGPLATYLGLAHAFRKTGRRYESRWDGFMPVSESEWAKLDSGEYMGKDFHEVHLEDARKDNVPETGTPYAVFVDLDRDSYSISDSLRLSYDKFMEDDRVLMLAGSPENRETLAGMYFGAEKDGGLDRESVYSRYRISDKVDPANPSGRQVMLRAGGFECAPFDPRDGRHGVFVAVSDGTPGSGITGSALEKLVLQGNENAVLTPREEKAFMDDYSVLFLRNKDTVMEYADVLRRSRVERGDA